MGRSSTRRELALIVKICLIGFTVAVQKYRTMPSVYQYFTDDVSDFIHRHVNWAFPPNEKKATLLQWL